MSEFKTYTLDQLCIVGSSKRVHLSDYVQQGIPFYRSKEVIELSSGKNISEQLFISSEKYSEIKSKFPVPQENDVLITAVGTIGEILVVKDPNFYFKDGNLIWLRNINFEIIDIDYLYYFLKSDLFQKTIKYNNIGAVQKALTIDFFKTVKITLPSLDNQRKLVSVLKSIGKKLKINNQINQELEAMAKTLYDYWFVQFDFPDQNGNPYKSSGGKMVYNPELKREIPEGWGVTKLNEVVDLISGYPFSSNDYVTSGKYKLYTIKNVQDGYTVDKVDNYLDFLPSNMSHECQLRRGDLIMSLTGNVGRVGMVYEDDVLLNQRVLKLNPFNKTHKSFIYSFFRSDVTKAHLENMSTGTSQKNLSPIDIGNMMIPFPSESLLSKFLDNLNMLENNFVENQQLTQLRDWLLPMLMNGQVKVK